MTNENASQNRWEALDIAWVFRIYAWIAIFGGVFLIAWGGAWFGAHLEGLPWGKVVILRVLGAYTVLVGFCALAIAAIDNPATLRKALLLFSVGHAIVGIITLVQTTVIDTQILSQISVFYLSTSFVLLVIWGNANGPRQPAPLVSLFSGSAPSSMPSLRSQYERQIGEAARQEERNRLARDLHDSVKQQIFAIQTAAATAQVRFDSDAEGAREALSQIRNAAREASGEMQAMLDQLRAAPLENAGLTAAIQQLCDATSFRTGADVQCSIAELPPSHEFLPGAQEAILRVCQEALSNTARHARAKHISLSLSASGGRIQLQIRDDGAGFEILADSGGRGQGLANMRARAEEFGGTFDIDSALGKGTLLNFSIPYTPAEPARVYARRAILYAAAFLPSVVLLFWRASPGFEFVSVLLLLGAVRNAAAWTRLHRLARRSIA
ncbi:MAG: sensor histidine kinase [Bryobacteraceae bacterium]